MYRVTKNYGHDNGFSCVFRQYKADSHCRFLHGYALSFSITFEAETLDERNWVIDFGGMTPIKDYLAETFDHKLLVSEYDPHMEELLGLAGLDAADAIMVRSVGCEAFAEMVGSFVRSWLRDNFDYDTKQRKLRLVSVTVSEHGSNSATITY